MSELTPEQQALYEAARERFYEALNNLAGWMVDAGVTQEDAQADLEEYVSGAVEAAYREE